MVHAMPGGPFDAFLHHKFGFLSRNEHARSDFQIEIAERRMAGDVLQWLTFGSTIHHGMKPFHGRRDGIPGGFRIRPSARFW